MFWSSATLRVRLPRIFLFSYDPAMVETSSYAMKLGNEAYISSPQSESSTRRSIDRLAIGDAFAIPPGQFAHLITHETITMPADALALLSVKNTFKKQGLINISGFHVDPGYVGRILYTVYNAGPVPIHLRCGEPIFLIWFATLDKESDLRMGKPIIEHLNTADIISGVVPSYDALAIKFENLATRQDKIDNTLQILIAIVVAIVAALVVGIFLELPKDNSPSCVWKPDHLAIL